MYSIYHSTIFHKLFFIEMNKCNTYSTKNGLNDFVQFSEEMVLKTKILDKKEQDKINVSCTFQKYFRTR